MLQIPEEKFWKCTPRYFFSQLSAHKEITKIINGGDKSSDSEVQDGYIDNIPGW